MEKKDESAEDKLLKKATAEELRRFIKEQAGRDVPFQRQLNKWLYRNYGEGTLTSEDLVARVRSLFCYDIKESTRNSWYDVIDYDWYYVVAEMDDILESIRKLLNRGNTSVVVEPIFEFFRILQKIWHDEMEEGIDDDSESDAGLLEGAHKHCVALLCEWAQNPGVPAADRYRMLDEYLAIRKVCSFDEYWMYTMACAYIDLRVAVLPPEEAYKEIERLYMSEKRNRRIVGHKIKLCGQLGRMKEMEATVWENVRYIEFVQNELHRLCKIGRLNDALKLAEESIRVNGENKETLHAKLDIVRLMKDTPAIIDTHFRLAIHGDSDLQDYRNLKALVPPNRWYSFYERIVEALRRYDLFDYLAAVYKEENELDALYKLITKLPYGQMPFIRKYLPILPTKYHADLINRGIDIFKKQAQPTARREEYTEFANRIKSFSKLPGTSQPVEELLLFLRATYKRRPAMIDELNKVFPLTSTAVPRKI